MRVTETIAQTRAYLKRVRSEGKSVGLVPTMGALHEGHLSLIRKARANEDTVAVSVFVNPTQFGPDEDYEEYERDLRGDAEKADAEGADLLFAPSVEEMYPREPLTVVHVRRLTAVLCGAYREGHFDGVTLVCSKLFNIFQPDRAYFGQKDYQQLQVLRRMVEDLNFPMTIVPVPTVREADGLAMSSRNKYLTEQQRRAAPTIHEALSEAAEAVKNGASGDEAERIVKDRLAGEPLIAAQYVSAVHPETLQPADWSGPPMVIATAAFVGEARLIDNIVIEA